MFGFGVKRRWIDKNPCQGIEFFPVAKNVKYVPPEEHIARVVACAKPDDVDYLVTIKDTMARVGEINRLTWDDVQFEERCVLLYTRKKKGGNLTPRKVTMTQRLFRLLVLRYQRQDPAKPWVFWHRHWDRRKRCWIEGPYTDRKGLMRVLCGRGRRPLFPLPCPAPCRRIADGSGKRQHWRHTTDSRPRKEEHDRDLPPYAQPSGTGSDRHL